MEEYTAILATSLLSGYITFRFLDRWFGYYRERKYLDKLLEYGLFGIAGFLVVYFLSNILAYFLDWHFVFNDFIIVYNPLIWFASLFCGYSYQSLFGYTSRQRKMSLFEKYHMNDYRKGWVIVHLLNGDIFYGKLSLTDIDYECDRETFSIKFVKKLDKKYKLIKIYPKKVEMVFNNKNLYLTEYIQGKRKI